MQLRCFSDLENLSGAMSLMWQTTQRKNDGQCKEIIETVYAGKDACIIIMTENAAVLLNSNPVFQSRTCRAVQRPRASANIARQYS
jgi:hypothetical protein